MLILDRDGGSLFSKSFRYDPSSRSWLKHSEVIEGEPIELLAAVTWLQQESGHPIKVPVGVIGPRDPPPASFRIAEEIGGGLASMGLTVLCGGRQGIMEAVCRGAAAKGGLTVGLLPGTDPAEANSYVAVPIATGIGEARNALIARAAFCLIAIGNSSGTLSEVALGLQFGKTVIGIGDAARVAGVRQFDNAQEVLLETARVALDIESKEGD